MRSINIGVADITDLEKTFVMEVLNEAAISPSSRTKEFEERIANQHGMNYATCCNSGQSALELSLMAFKRKFPNLKYIMVPTITYISTIHAVWNSGLESILCDVDPNTYNINLESFFQTNSLFCHPSEIGIIPVHMFGKSILKHELFNCMNKQQFSFVLEDNCESFGASGVGYGDAMALSFYTAHTLSLGGGGAVLTNDIEFNDYIKRICNHGRINPADIYSYNVHNNYELSKKFIFNEHGYSYKFNDIQAAIGLAQMERIDDILFKRKFNGTFLIEKLKKYTWLQVPSASHNTFMMFPIVCDSPEIKKRLVPFLNARKIETRDMMPITNQPIVMQMFDKDVDGFATLFPVADNINKCGFYIGCHQCMNQEDLDYIVETFSEFGEQV